MNDPHDNAHDDRAALEKYSCTDCETAGVDHEALVETEGKATLPKDDRIEDEAGLMRAFASLRRANLALAQNKRLQAPVLEEARRELAALEERCAKANAALEARAEHHRNRIEVYARLHRDELVQGKRKTRDFGIGSVSFKRAGGEYRWRKDMKPAEREAALLGWAQDFQKHVDDVTLTFQVHKPDVDAIKYVLALMSQDNGETAEAPGLEYVPEHEELKIETGLEAKEEK